MKTDIRMRSVTATASHWMLIVLGGALAVTAVRCGAGGDGSTATCSGGYLDPATSLCWQDPPAVAELNWDGAVAYCDGLSLAGHGPGSWHLPTISEMRSLVRGCPATETGGACGVTDECLGEGCLNTGCDGCPSGDGPGAEGAYCPPGLRTGPEVDYWSSSSYAGDASQAWGVLFGNGGYVNYYYKTDTSVVRCVRRGP